MNNSRECWLSRYIEKRVEKVEKKINRILVLKWKVNGKRQSVIIYIDDYI